MLIFKTNQALALRCFSLCKNLNRSVIGESRGSNYKIRQPKIVLLEETKAVMAVLPKIRNEILDEQLIYHEESPELRQRFVRLIDYHLDLEPRYLSKTIFFVHAYKLLEKERLTDDKLRLACILGWCHRLIDASVVMDDDIADESDIRYDKPTWHKLEGVGVQKAILDAAFMETGLYYLILNHFSSHPQYCNIKKTMLRAYSYTNVAQVREIGRRQVGELEKYQDFVKFYSFTLPVIKSALYLANIEEKTVHTVVEELSIDIARFLKIQDDVMCVFSPFSEIQKPCTDISEGRASWLAIEAHKRASKSQKEILEQHYGMKHQKSVEKVYDIFRELKLKEVYDQFEEEFYEKTYSKICEKLPKSVPHELFVDLLDFAMTGQYRV